VHQTRGAVTGSFYPTNSKELSNVIDNMFTHAAPSPVDGPILAAVAPLAGYPYSGPVAAWAFAALGDQTRGAFPSLLAHAAVSATARLIAAPSQAVFQNPNTGIR
jgi:AmmeMemoRadiSam system protein B